MYRRGDLGQVARALNVLGALRGFKHGRIMSELSAEVGVSERTVRRDIAELQDAGFDIELGKRDNRSIACLVDDRNYSPVPITKRERFTLLAVRSVFDVLRGTPFLDDVNSVLAKLEQRMSAKEREEQATFGERFVYLPDHGTKSYDGKDDIIDAIQTGILSRKVVRYRYGDSSGRAKGGHLAPYAMVLRSWHKTQRIDKLPDGRIRLSFTCLEIASTVSWILEWGPHARVVAPSDLVQLVKNELDRAREQY